MKNNLIFIKLVSILLLIPIFASAAVSPGIKPNSFFYFLDTGLENIVLFFTSNSENKAKKALEYADERLAEIEASAEDKNSGAIKTATIDYENKIALATEKSKEVKDKGQEENLLNLIADNTSKNQEVLSAVLIKVPEEAKQAITQAIESSRKGQEEATRQIAELKSEVEQLKKEVAELKAKDEAQTKAVEELNKQKLESVPAPTKLFLPPAPAITPDSKPIIVTPTPSQAGEKKITNITTLPNGAVVEMDASGNILHYIKEAPVLVPIPTPVPPPASNVSQIQITSVNVVPSNNLVSLEWETNIPTNGRVFVSGYGITTIVRQSNSGISTHHIAEISPLKANTSYNFEIEAISDTRVSKYNSSFKTISLAKIEVGFARNDSKPVTATGWNKKEVYAQVYGENGERLQNVRVNITTPDESQNKIIDFIGNIIRYNQSNTLWMDYYPKFAGTHTITFSVPTYDLTKKIDVEAIPYVRQVPEIRFFERFYNPAISVAKNELPKEIARITISSPDLNDEYAIRDVNYKIISDTLMDQDIKLSLWEGTIKLDFINPFNLGSLPRGSSKDVIVKLDSMEKTGKFKLSISAKAFSSGEWKEFTPANLPLITSEIEVK